MESMEPLALIQTLEARFAAAFVAGCVAGFLVAAVGARRRVRAIHADVEAAAERLRLEREALELRLAERDRELARQDGRVAELAGRLAMQESELVRRADALAERHAAAAALQARLEENRKSYIEKEALLNAQGDALRREFELLANRIFENQGQLQQNRLTSVLTPLREQLSDFRARVEAVYTTETRDRASLLAEVRNLQQASERINREAENLTRALKGDVKTQGNWGELVLERVLEASGLRAGHEYFLQAARRDDEGAVKRPDVIIRLPDGKDVVVDAKLSLLAYESAVGAENDAARQSALREHVASLRTHVRRLGEQDYDRLQDVRSLDFVLLFVPIEAAFAVAMEHDPRLFNEAFERRIVIVSPTTLMMTLRIIHNVWSYEKRNRNAEEIARRAGALYDKVRGLAEDLEALGRQLQNVDNIYRGVMGKLSTGRGNVIRQVEEFRGLGATVRRPIARGLLDDSSAPDDQDPAPAAEGFSTDTALPPDPAHGPRERDHDA